MKSALISGGAQGIGLGIGLHLLQENFRVFALDCDAEAGKAACAKAKSDHFHFIDADISDETSIKSAIRTLTDHVSALNLLVNNAAIADPANQPIEALPLVDWQTVINTNLTGYFLTTKYALPLLKKAGGSIVNIASTRALQSEPHTEAYAATKGAILALTHALAISYGPDIRVNCISPGWIDVSELQRHPKPSNLSTEDHHQHPAGRVGMPSDVAAMVSFLAGDQAAFITGQNFIVDGGMTRKMIYAN